MRTSYSAKSSGEFLENGMTRIEELAEKLRGEVIAKDVATEEWERLSDTREDVRTKIDILCQTIRKTEREIVTAVLHADD